MPIHHSKSHRTDAPASMLKPSLPAHAPPAVKAATQGGGQALDKHTSAEMSAKFGHDFSQVRVHTDSRAGDAADALGANAYALGGDIVFGAGKYLPGSSDTERLLAHELTHVVQQARGGTTQHGVSRPGDVSEREAERASEAVALGRTAQVGATPTAAISCSFLNGDDPENDFWGTKEMFGPRWSGTANGAMSVASDLVGLAPVVGPGINSLIDVGKMSAAGAMSGFLNIDAGAHDFFGMGGGTAERQEAQTYENAAGRFTHDLEYDASGAIPGFGTATGIAATATDATETLNRATGGKENPLSGDIFDKTANDL